MKGLLLKDCYLATKLCRSLLLIDLFLIVAAAFAPQDSFFMLAYPCLTLGVLPMSLISLEEKEKWDQYAGTLPCTRAQLVSAKYLLALTGCVVAMLLAALVQAFRMTAREAHALGEALAVVLPLGGIGLILPAILYPFIYRFGAEKGRLIYYAVFGAGWVVALSLNQTDGAFLAGLKTPLLLAGIPVAAAGLYAASWLLSIHFYQKREL